MSHSQVTIPKNNFTLGRNFMSIKISPRKPTQPPITERLAVSKKEAAAMLNVSERSLDNWRRDGKIIARKIGSRVLFPLESLRAFISGIEPTDN